MIVVGSQVRTESGKIGQVVDMFGNLHAFCKVRFADGTTEGHDERVLTDVSADVAMARANGD